MEKANFQLESLVPPASSAITGASGSTFPNSKSCEFCGLAFIYEEIGAPGTPFRGKFWVAQCDCRERHEAAKIERERKAVFEKLVNDQIPPRFRACRLEGFKPRNREQDAAYRQIMHDPAGSFLIVGAYAAGKTHLLFAQFRHLVETGARAYARTTYELIDELRKDELGERESRIMRDIDDRRLFHLFWDDADKVKVTEWKMEILFSVIDAIYRNEMRLTMTCNLNLSELQDKLSPAIVRRIDDICNLVEL